MGDERWRWRSRWNGWATGVRSMSTASQRMAWESRGGVEGWE